MTREQYIDLIKTRLKRIDSADRFHAQYVEGVLDLVWQSTVFQQAGTYDTDVNFYTKKYTPVAVSLDASNNYYSDLPDKIIHLPRVSSGIVRINQINGRGMDFSPVNERTYTMMISQEVYQLTDKIVYWVDFDQVHYGSNMTPAIAAAGVDIRMIIPFSSYDLDEDIPLPIGQADMFIAKAIQLLKDTTPVELTNINSETLP